MTDPPELAEDTCLPGSWGRGWVPRRKSGTRIREETRCGAHAARSTAFGFKAQLFLLARRNPLFPKAAFCPPPTPTPAEYKLTLHVAQA